METCVLFRDWKIREDTRERDRGDRDVDADRGRDGRRGLSRFGREAFKDKDKEKANKLKRGSMMKCQEF